MRILHIDTGAEMRGGQWQLLMLARGLHEHGCEQIIASPTSSALSLGARDERFSVLALAPGRLAAARRLRSVIRSQRFDVIHAHDGRGQTLAWLASAGIRVRRIASRRVCFAPRLRLAHRLKYTLTCDGVIAVSQYVRGLLIQQGIPLSRIEVIYDGVELPRSLPDASARSQARRDFKLADDDFVVGSAGAFTWEKGQSIALEAFRLLERDLPSARLLLAGDGPLRRRLEDRARPLKRVLFLGTLPHLAPLFAASDLFVMPSRSEGLGSAAIAAMAYGLPVVASRIGGLPEIVEDGENGWLVEPGSPPALAEAIRRAAQDRLRLRKAGERAREKARRFTSDIMTAHTMEFYRRV